MRTNKSSTHSTIAPRLRPWVHGIHHLNNSLGECTKSHNLSACLYFSFHSIWFSSLLHLFKTMYVQSGINYRRCVITCDIFYGLQYVNWIGMLFFFFDERVNIIWKAPPTELATASAALVGNRSVKQSNEIQSK